ncbi:MAG: TolC family protein [Saprospiraceae bacterium]|nr:TolC family protein [Saprospiraceae bacterium]MCF8248879.1 TolC family protein [Saprospiraceae bacterium]MCF8279604.1 TolC family protein [Bacteroidales bacterium]MCF8310164.1 TolC family protein [Saprospiraceae bacterium]MCF8439064.1 TolC family protein [Saprospiraceae bacterium]
MKSTFFLFLFSLFLAKNLEAQTDTMSVSLEEIVALAQSDAPDALLAETRMKNRYWFYQSILADYKPGLNFESTLPDLNRSIGLISLPDGSSTFVQQSQVVNSVGLSLNQRVAKTGGTIFARSNLQRLDLLVPKAPNETSYFSTPFSIGFQQPVFGYNELKWNKKIEPLRYQEATRSFAEQMEKVAFDASNLFFEVFISQLNLRAARQDKANADTLFNISKGRFEVGRIAETELLQIELSSMNADAAVQQALLDLQSGTERLRNYLGIRKSIFFKLEAPEVIPIFTVKPEEALQYASQFRSDVIGFERRLAEADASVAEAKSNRGFQMDIFGQLGFSQKGANLNEAYDSPEDYQRVVVGLTMPILDWGRGRARLETANSNRELERMNVEQDRVNFEQEILLKVKQFDLLRNQVSLAKRAYDVSLKREDMTRNRYYIGKIDVLDLGVAVTEKEAARRSYMSALRAFWLAYYDLRQITLFDFERNVSLVRRVEGY